MPSLDPNPQPFQPTGCYTTELHNMVNKKHLDFLLPWEQDLMHNFMCKQNQAFTWNDQEQGYFKPEYFPPIDILVIPHVLFIKKNIPIPSGIYQEVCTIIRKKLAAGVYKASNSSYYSRWFCVLKKDKNSLQIIHSLEPLNKITIKHAGVPPITDHLAEQFCGAMLDLYVGYNEQLIAESSCDYTTFQTSYGALQLVMLPMDWTNSVSIFHDDITYIL